MAASSHPKFEYKKNDRTILNGYSTDVSDWRQEFLILDTELRQAAHDKSLNTPSSAELKKASSSFHKTLTNYFKHSEQIHLDQKFFQFNQRTKILEKQLADIKDENLDETYQHIFNSLQKSIQEQLKHEYKLQEAAILYLDQLVGQLRTPEIEEKTKQLANVKRLMEQRIAFLTTRSEQLSTGKNQRAISSVEGMRQKAEQWVRKIPRIIQQCDDLMMELEKREKHFQTLEKQLNTLNSQTSLNKFPSLGEPRKHLQHLVKKIEKYKKTLVVLGKKTQLEIEELNASIRNCNITMSFIDYKKKFQKIYKALAENYENILAEAMKIEDEINACRKVIVDADTKCGGSLSTEVKLCEQLKEKVQTDKKHFSKCYQTFTLEKSAEFRDEQNRIMRVNCLLQNIYDNLTIIEDEMKKAGHDNRGVILFKKKFASILINNTVHEEDLEKPVKKYLEWLHYLENSEAIHIHSNEYLEAIKRCRRDMIQVRNELIRWRTPTSSYAVSTTMRFFSPAIFTMLGIVIPGANLLPSGLTQNAVLMNHLQTATETVVQVGGKQAYTKVTDTLSPTERGSDFDDPDFTEKKIQLKEKMTVAGKRRIINQPKDDCKLSLDLSYLWRDTLQVQIKKAVFNKSMVLTGISTSISLALGLTGVGTPLALGLLVAGTAAGNMSLVAFDEYQQCVEEARIRFQTEERLKEIGDAIQSLERFPERHILNKYFLFTMDFIVKLIIHMRVEKEDLNVDMSLQQMLDYLVVILNIPSADLLPTTTSETNIEVKRQDLAPLLDFLKTEVEGKEGLQTTIQFLNSAHSTTDAKTLETKLMIARQHILKLEKILKILDIHCAVGKTSLQKSFAIFHEYQAKIAKNDRFFKSPEAAEFLKIQKSLQLLLGEESISLFLEPLPEEITEPPKLILHSRSKS